MKFSIVIAVCVAFVQGAPLIALSPGSEAAPNSYIVVLKNHELASTFQSSFNTLALRLKTNVVKTEIIRQFKVIPAFHVRASSEAVKELQSHPDVDYIEHDAIVSINSVQQPNPPSWGLTRISERALDLTQPYVYGDYVGQGITAYVVDTGVLKEHVDFGGRAIMGINTVDDSNTDLNGHGTHVAGTIGGAIMGVAKKVQIVDVKVLNKFGQGQLSGIIGALNWIYSTANRGKSVVNMSLGTPKSPSMDDIIAKFYSASVPVIAAAGNNETVSACSYSPAGSMYAFTVSASDRTDTIANFASYGNCVNIFAPGVGITSTWFTGIRAANTISGTSMAAPHVAGVAALFLSEGNIASSKMLFEKLSNTATNGVIKGDLRQAPNKLVFNGQ
ncbi:putative secreted serine protease [Mortierella sp. GBAus27b]|nr:hypothetical protein BGX31_001140 [Mortierella sp. GBA43]KAI8351353.1 putative secreted serine protease [Mortierella sp. GBAus27b]